MSFLSLTDQQGFPITVSTVWYNVMKGYQVLTRNSTEAINISTCSVIAHDKGIKTFAVAEN